MVNTFRRILDMAKDRGPKKVAVAVSEDRNVLEAIADARAKGIAECILIGNADKTIGLLKEMNYDIAKFHIVHEEDETKAARKAVSLVRAGEAHVVMKGLLETSILMKAVLDKEIGLRGKSILSHVSVLEVNGIDRLLYMTDAAMNIAPTLEDKVRIIENSVAVFKALENNIPMIGVICAVEKVNEKMEATVHAKRLVQMNQKGEIKDCIIGGPFALDNAISMEAVRIKNITHPVAGRADILLVPNIEAGNVLYKSLTYFANARSAGIIAGATAPVVLASRTDSRETKLNSIAIGVIIAG